MERRAFFKSLAATVAAAALPLKLFSERAHIDTLFGGRICGHLKSSHVVTGRERQWALLKQQAGPAVTVIYECNHVLINGGSVADPAAILSEAAGLMTYENGEGECRRCAESIRIHPFDLTTVLNRDQVQQVYFYGIGLHGASCFRVRGALETKPYKMSANFPPITDEGKAMVQRLEEVSLVVDKLGARPGD